MNRPATLGVFCVYSAALLQGLALVSFPASASFLMAKHGISDAQYGAIFLPQVAFAVIGALFGGHWAGRLGLERLLLLAMLANLLSQIALAGTSWVPLALVYPLILLGTACLGLGFGLLGAPLNSLPARYFPKHRDTALVIAHTMLGAGLMAGPLLMTAMIGLIGWTAFPATLALMCVVVTMAVLGLENSATTGDTPKVAVAPAKPVDSMAFWLFIAIAVLYAFAEGTFSNWVVVYLQHGKGLSDAVSVGALSAFWAALVGGRLLVSLLVLRVSATLIWRVMPLLMIVAFLALPYATTPTRAIAVFALAGFACSAFFPLSIALASARFPSHVAWVSSMLIAALMIGVGLGSFAIGSLREMVSFESLYRVSALYPLIVLALACAMAWLERAPRAKEA